MTEYPTWLIDTAFVLPVVAFTIAALGWLYDRHIVRVRTAVEKATAAAELAARLDAQDTVLHALADGFTRQFGTNGFVLHQMVKEQGAALSVVRQGLADHVAQHVDRSFGR